MDGSGQDPGCRIGQKQDALYRKPCKCGGKPDDSEQTCAGQGHNHGGNGIAQSAHDPHDYLHDPAQKIGRRDPQKPCLSGRYDGRIRRIDGQKRCSQEIDADAHDQSDYSHKSETGIQDPVDALRLSGSGILAGEAYSSLVDCVHGDVDKLFNICSGAVSGHNHRTKRVDGGLDQHIGKGKQGTLYSGRQSDLHHPAQTTGLDIKFPDIQTAWTLHPAQAEKDQDCADALGDDGGKRDSCHVHMQDDHKKQIQDYINHTCCRKEIQRPFGIPGGTQDGASEIVSHGCRHSDEDNFQVQGSFVKDIGRSAHPDQKRSGEKHADSDEYNTGDQADGNCRMYIVTGPLLITASQRVPDRYVGSDGKADKKIDQKVRKRTGRSHCRQGFVSCKTPNYDHICSIEEKLQAAGKH